MDYYKIKEFPIVVGNQNSGNALCVGWWDAFRLADDYPKLSEKCAIIGSLYLAQGINVMIRNLALNPGIRILYLWRHNEDSLTERGIYATKTLLNLWQGGVNDLRMCGEFTLEKEISLEVFNQIRTSVEIHVIDEISVEDLEKVITMHSADPYMEPCQFPDSVYVTPAVFPSEQLGFVVHCKTIYEAWLETLFRINRFGTLHENSGVQTKRLLSFTWVATNETANVPECVCMPETLQVQLSVTSDLILEYASNYFLVHRDTAGSSYSYGNRLYRWMNVFDQVEAIVSLLQENPATRRAYASIVEPSHDLSGKMFPPCLVGIQFLQNNGVLNALAVLRSHDIFQAGLTNAFGILHLLRFIAERVSMEQGSVSITSHDAHIYIRDIQDVNQLVSCARNAATSELTEAEMDVRGSFLVRLSDETIVVDFIDSAGQRLERFSETTADALVQKMARCHLTGSNQSGHGYYLGVQIARAEECLHRGIPFVQDEPIPS